MTPIPFLFYKYGARIREGSTFAPGIVSLCILYIIGTRLRRPFKDLRIAKELELEKKAGLV